MLRRQAPGRRQRCEVVATGQVIVEHHHVKRAGAVHEQVQGRPCIAGLDDPATSTDQCLGQRPADQRLVVDDQDADRADRIWCGFSHDRLIWETSNG